MEADNFQFAILITLFAGLATGIGSFMAFFTRNYSPKFLAGSLGFSAGVMIYVSFAELLPVAKESLTEIHGAKMAELYSAISFFIGIAVIAIIDKLVPSGENPHEFVKLENTELVKNRKLYRLGMFSAIVIAIHNFPEGLATFMAAMNNPTLGVSVAVAVAIHNIPEGVAVSVPIYYATKSKTKALTFSFLSGLAEPLGALFGYVILTQFFSEDIMGLVLAGVAGIMVFISLDELLPTAEEYGEHHTAIYWLIAGMAVMALSLILFNP